MQTLEAFEPTTKAEETRAAADLRPISMPCPRPASCGSPASSLTIPGVFWYVVLIGALINIVLIWMLDMRFFTHLILGGLISFFLGVMIFLLIAMDQPLRGAVAIPPTAYELVYRVLMAPDEST